MVKMKYFQLAGAVVLAAAALSPASPATAQFFASTRAEKAAPEGARASADALLGLSQVLAAVSKLEAHDASAADAEFKRAGDTIAGSAQAFDTLSRSEMAQKKIDLAALHPDERTFLNDPGLLALGNKRLETMGDVFALTAGALSVALKNIDALNEKRSAESYAVVRDDLSLLLRIGQVASTLLASAD